MKRIRLNEKGDFVSDSKELQIRLATSEDVPIILGLIKAIAEYEKLLHEVVADEATLKESLFGSRPSAEVLLAEVSGETVGFALFFMNFSTFIGRHGLYLEDLFINPEHRGSGYGYKLLRRLAEIAKERNCGRMEWAVLDWNKPAISFYESLGAKPMDGWTIYRLQEDSIANLANSDS